jgi:hypothetical protein
MDNKHCEDSEDKKQTFWSIPEKVVASTARHRGSLLTQKMAIMMLSLVRMSYDRHGTLRGLR